MHVYIGLRGKWKEWNGRIKGLFNAFKRCMCEMAAWHEEGKHSNEKEMAESNDISKSNKRISNY